MKWSCSILRMSSGLIRDLARCRCCKNRCGEFFLPGCKQILWEDVEDAGGCLGIRIRFRTVWVKYLSGAVSLQEIGSSWGVSSTITSCTSTRTSTCGGDIVAGT